MQQVMAKTKPTLDVKSLHHNIQNMKPEDKLPMLEHILKRLYRVYSQKDNHFSEIETALKNAILQEYHKRYPGYFSRRTQRDKT
jgi:hypothetical protein